MLDRIIQALRIFGTSNTANRRDGRQNHALPDWNAHSPYAPGIPVVTDCMFPEALLPNASPNTRQPLRPHRFHVRQGFRKSDLDVPPAAGKIRIVFRQGPYTMHVVGQNDPGVDMKRCCQANRADRGAKGFNFADQQVRPAVCQVYREKVGSPWNAIAAVFGHFRNISTFLRCRNRLVFEGYWSDRWRAGG